MNPLMSPLQPRQFHAQPQSRHQPKLSRNISPLNNFFSSKYSRSSFNNQSAFTQKVHLAPITQQNLNITFYNHIPIQLLFVHNMKKKTLGNLY